MRSNLSRFAKLIPLLFFVLPGSAWAAGSGPIQRVHVFATIPTPDVNVTNLRGKVTVRGWDRSQVHAVYLMASRRIEIDAAESPSTGDAERIELMTHLLDPALRGPKTEVDYQLDVPQASSLEIRNPEGVVRVEGLSGYLWIESVGGGIFINDASGHVVARSVGGQIQITRSSGYVEASSIMGSLKFVSTTSSRIHARTSSGGIVYEGNVVPDAVYDMETYSGDINILCPPSASFNLDARSVHGKVVHLLKVNRRPHHPTVSYYGEALYGTHNQGGASLELTSFRGTIYIRPQNQP